MSGGERPPVAYARELTARGTGAISVIEVVGPGALERVRSLAGEQARLAPPFALVRLLDRDPAPARAGLLDEALALIDSPERVELHLHGSPALVRRVLALLAGAPPPARRPTLEERADEALAASATEAAARMLLDQREGALRRELERLCDLETAAFSRAACALVARGRTARALLRPPCVVLAGPVNAGKSTLFNLLVGRERALVDAAEGTTRDALRERALLGRYAVDLIDTAGTREVPAEESARAVERAGQELARRLTEQADLVLELVPAREAAPSLAHADDPRLRRLFTRGDEAPQESAGLPAPVISALRSPARAREVIEQLVLAALQLPPDPWHAGDGVPFFEELQGELEASLDALDEPGARERLRAFL